MDSYSGQKENVLIRACHQWRSLNLSMAFQCLQDKHQLHQHQGLPLSHKDTCFLCSPNGHISRPEHYPWPHSTSYSSSKVPCCSCLQVFAPSSVWNTLLNSLFSLTLGLANSNSSFAFQLRCLIHQDAFPGPSEKELGALGVCSHFILYFPNAALTILTPTLSLFHPRLWMILGHLFETQELCLLVFIILLPVPSIMLINMCWLSGWVQRRAMLSWDCLVVRWRWRNVLYKCFALMCASVMCLCPSNVETVEMAKRSTDGGQDCLHSADNHHLVLSKSSYSLFLNFFI